MKSVILSMMIVVCLESSAGACDKCRQSRRSADMSSVTMTAAPVMTMTVVPGSNSVATVPLTTSGSSLSYVSQGIAYPAPVSVVSLATPQNAGFYPMRVVQSDAAGQTVFPQAWVSPSAVYYSGNLQPVTLTDAQAQGLISDLIFGLARPTACQVCRSMGCTSGDGTSADPVKSLRESIQEIGEIIKAVKGLEKELKDAVSETSPDAKSSGHDSDVSQIARLTEIRDQLRTLQRPSVPGRLASHQQ